MATITQCGSSRSRTIRRAAAVAALAVLAAFGAMTATGTSTHSNEAGLRWSVTVQAPDGTMQAASVVPPGAIPDGLRWS